MRDGTARIVPHCRNGWRKSTSISRKCSSSENRWGVFLLNMLNGFNCRMQLRFPWEDDSSRVMRVVILSQHWKTNRLTSTNLQYYYVFLPAAYEMQSELLEANYISYTILLAWKPSFKFLNRLVLLNLYVRDTDSRCKNTKFIVNKRIMLVKFLMLFYKNQHFFEMILDEIW